MSIFTTRSEPYADGRLGRPGALELADIKDALIEYKARVAKRYRVAPPDQLDRMLPGGPLLISPKIDGELWFAVKRHGEVALCAPNGRVLMGVAVVRELEKHLASAPDVIIAGELFVRSKTPGQRPRVFHVSKALNDSSRAPDLGFQAFDLAKVGDEDALLWTYERRLTQLRAWLPSSGQASMLTTIEGDRGEAKRRYDEWVGSDKFEGIVVRGENGLTYKVKPAVTIDAVLIAFGERLATDGSGRIEVRELNVALVRDDGNFHIAGSVGTGLSDAQRAEYHAKLSAMVVDSEYKLVNREGTLCRFVRPEIVVELRVSDLLPVESTDSNAQRMVVRWDPNEGWKTIGAVPLPALLHPIFMGERADKPVDAANVGLDQIRQIMPLLDDEETAPSASVPRAKGGLPASRIVARKAWVKVTKGARAVRKYVAWATEKAKADERYPPFVVCFTDFSAGRKTPLERELRVASSEEKLRAHIAAWEADNVKKGWTEAV